MGPRRTIALATVRGSHGQFRPDPDPVRMETGTVKQENASHG